MTTEEKTQCRHLSDTTKRALEKLPTAEAVAVLDDLISRVADQNNAQNNNGGSQLGREEMLGKISKLSEAQLKDVLKAQGIL